MRITGNCHCKDISYQAEVNSEKVIICHCTDCQKMSGSPYRVIVMAQEENFKLQGSEPKQYVKTSDRGAPRIQAFCSECGTHIFATSTDNIGKRTFNIRLGTVNEKEKLNPTMQVWCRSAQGWAFNIQETPRLEKQPQ